MNPFSAEDTWKEVLSNISGKIPPQSFKTWLEPAKGASIKGNILTVDVPNMFFVDWIEEHYRKIIEIALLNIVGSEISIKFNPIERGIKPKKEKERLYRIDSHNLQKRYTFKTFVVGSGNRFAHAAALAVSKSPGQAYNPLFIYGAVGLGKTHLIQAIGNYVTENTPGSKVYYTSCEKFLNEMVDAIQNSTMIQFKKRYRGKDILLIDDLQFIENKEGLQEEIFHTFNSLHDTGRQIIMTSDRPPIEINGIEERLLSRFQWGLVCDLKPPDFETRIAILKTKAELAGASVSNDILIYIAQRIKSNIRELEGALVTLLALTSLTDTKLTLDSSRQMLDDILGREKITKISIERIQEVVSNHYAITPQALRGKRRTRSISFPRQVAIYLSREQTDLSLKAIGKAFGGRDHSTILHDYDKIKSLIAKDDELKIDIEQLSKKIKEC
ncbi:chromosomal replication initiator protein DnaA [candidate division WOR-3 bacterium]|nr:chromosomal replication initiator protein DnaA [candidate division WOR-3 bacterium]